jgi:predicted dehydrogenase
VFFYGIHQVDCMLSLLDARPVSVSTTRQGKDGIATITFDGGAFGVVHCLDGWGGGFTGTVFSEKGSHHATLGWDPNVYLAGIQTFCRMFETKKEPLPPSSYLRPVAVLAAMQKSFDTGKPAEVESVDL